MRELTIWLKIVLAVFPVAASAQSLTLDKAYADARNNYPLIRQRDLIRQTAGININNLGKGFLPQLSVNGQATYQSEVTSVDVPIPGVKIEAPEKDQYKLTADITQLIYDGGVTRQQKTLQQLNAIATDQQLEVELFKLKDRINQLYLSILLVDEQLKQIDLVKTDINTGIKRVEAQVQNGVAFKSNLNILKAELIKNDQRLIELRASRSSLVRMLSLFTGKEITNDVSLEPPRIQDVTNDSIARPELKLFDDQVAISDHQRRLISARNRPKTSLFIQGGYGRPGLNMLKNEFDFFYIGGVRLNWSFSGLYTGRNERKLVRINQDMISTQKETFLLNTNAEAVRQQGEIDKLRQLIDADNEIIALRRSVTDASKAQLVNAVITSSDYLREVNAEDQARQTLIFHQLQLLQAQINYQTIIGK